METVAAFNGGMGYRVHEWLPHGRQPRRLKRRPVIMFCRCQIRF